MDCTYYVICSEFFKRNGGGYIITHAQPIGLSSVVVRVTFFSTVRAETQPQMAVFALPFFAKFFFFFVQILHFFRFIHTHSRKKNTIPASQLNIVLAGQRCPPQKKSSDPGNILVLGSLYGVAEKAKKKNKSARVWGFVSKLLAFKP